MTAHLDGVDRRLLNCIQARFPIEREPFSVMGLWLDISGDQVIERINRLKRNGIVRLISPVLNARNLGYQTTLVAARVAEDKIDDAARIMSEHKGVSHCYQRNHDFNLWSTLAVPANLDISEELEKLKNMTGADEIFHLPTLQTFKIGAFFDAGGGGCPGHSEYTRGDITSTVDYRLTPADRALINELQRDLPLVERPFDTLSSRLGMDIDELLVQCRALLQRGIIRRFGASISHTHLGYVANGMSCWIAPPDKVKSAGEILAALPAVSHCYERKTNPRWPYNLFGMMHAQTRAVCEVVVERIASQTGLNDNILLFSTREYKKVRVNYPV